MGVPFCDRMIKWSRKREYNLPKAQADCNSVRRCQVRQKCQPSGLIEQRQKPATPIGVLVLISGCFFPFLETSCLTYSQFSFTVSKYRQRSSEFSSKTAATFMWHLFDFFRCVFYTWQTPKLLICLGQFDYLRETLL